MTHAKLVDHFGFTVGQPKIPEPRPRVLVWGINFFLLNEEDVAAKVEEPRYHITTGHVIEETRATPGHA